MTTTAVLAKLTPLPDIEKFKSSIKKDFEQRYRSLLGSSYDDFLMYSLSYLNKSIRVNTLKIPIAELKERLQQHDLFAEKGQSKGFTLYQVPWCKEGFWVKGERTDFGNLVEHTLGYFYIQEAASMIPAVVLNPQPGEVVLDLCASPGSKTTQMAVMMENKGIVVANDISGDRMKPLGINLQRMGILNVVESQARGQQLQRLKTKFDKILVDAPCSGTGTIRKSPETLKIWNPLMVRRLAGQQKTLIDTAFSLLKPGGTLVYSTCSVEPEENEGVVDFLLQKYPESAILEEIKLDINRSNTVLAFEKSSYSGEIRKCLRIWPQDNNTEGFFVAKIAKKG
ncbi:RsmB/NOP family class I SAM-dependent RNA methyltransferase [Candidatus Woesearchaeota archaeon]|nr:RsmB/NOP family class I SAM-dependent RNA methyltransferase [Candidatus Woesearchaeota archaeon]